MRGDQPQGRPPRYEEIIGQLRGPELLARMWADAEHLLAEEPGKIWTVVVVDERGRWVPPAWAAATVKDGVLHCSDNYECRGVGRTFGLYQVAYWARHTTVVAPSRLPAITYLFAQPIPLHEAGGWYRTGLSDTSVQPGIDPHEWWELRRDPTPGPS